MARNEAVGKARYELETDPTKLKKGLDDAGRTIKRTGAETEKVFAQQGTGAVSKFGTSLKTLDDRLVGMTQRGGLSGAILGGVGLGAGLSVFNTVQNLISGALDKVGQSITLASDKAEAASKANVLFRDSYAIVEKASRTAASTVAMSSGAYLTAAGNVGNLVTNMGVAGDAAARMSVDLIQLAADMGSFNNASSPEEVIEAIGAAFRGETEPIRAFGVMLSAAKVEAKALALGLKDGKKPLDDYAKAMATYQLILDQTGAAQGDLARTAGELANKERLAAARQEEALTRLGDALVPLAKDLLPALADAGTAAVEVLTVMVGAAKSLWSVVSDVNEFFKPWERQARLAREEAALWADELERMPEAATISRQALEGMARRAQEAGEGLAGAKRELIDLVRWIEATKDGGGSQLVGMIRNFEKWTGWLEAGNKGLKGLTLTQDEFDRKVRAMVRGGLKELEENLDLLPPQLADVVRSFTSGQDAVDVFVQRYLEGGKQVNQGGDWQAFWQFLMDSGDLIHEHWAQLPIWLQQALLKSGAVAATAAGAVTIPLHERLVEESRLFWTGAGATVFQPPASTVAPSPETLAAVSAAGKRLAGALDLDFSGTVGKGMSGAFRFIENNLGPGLKGAILTAKDDIDKAMDEVRWVMNHPKKWQESIDDTEGAIRKLLRARDRALRNGNPGLARYLEGQAGMMIGNWEELTGVAWDESLTIGQNFANGLRRKKPEVRGAANELVGAAKGPIIDGAGNAYKWGSLYAKNMAKGMHDNVSLVDTAAGDLSQVAKDHHKLSSPSKKGPWSTAGGPEAWGRRYALMIAKGMQAGRSDVAMASALLAGSAPSLAGWTMTASATQVVDHRISGSIAVGLDYGAMRAAGMSPEEMGRAARTAGEISLGDVLRTARATAGRGYLAPGRA